MHPDLIDIIGRRSEPGVLLTDALGIPRFVNEQAIRLWPDLGAPGSAELPGPIREMLRAFREGGPCPPRLANPAGAPGIPHALRVLGLGEPGGRAPASHLLVLMERVVDRHWIDPDSLAARGPLSRREAEVVVHIDRGLSNKEIARALFLSEHTVKDHIRNIMAKLDVGSRSAILARLRP